MIRLAVVAALLLAAPAAAATVEDPYNPRFTPGIRALGMVQGEVEVARVQEVAGIDPEPLYVARDRLTDRRAFFRSGEDLCMAKGKLGSFVRCDGRLARAAAAPIEPIRGAGITVWPTPPHRGHGGRGGGGGGGGGGGWCCWVPAVPAPDPETTPPAPAPVPLGGALGHLLAGALALGLIWAHSSPTIREIDDD